MNRKRTLAGWRTAARRAMDKQPDVPVARSVMTPEQRIAADAIERKRTATTHRGKNLVGYEFGKLLVWLRHTAGSAFNYWICLCGCGQITDPIPAHLLVEGQRTDCGCVEQERLRIARLRAAKKRKRRSHEYGSTRKLIVARQREQKQERKARSRRATH
jgi:hypothetical protein